MQVPRHKHKNGVPMRHPLFSVSTGLKKFSLVLAFMLLCSGPNLAWAQNDTAVRFDFPESSLSRQVDGVAQKAGLQVIYDGNTQSLRDAPVDALRGEFTLRAALDRVFSDSGLVYELVEGDTIVVKKARSGAAVRNAPADTPPRQAESEPVSETEQEEPAHLKDVRVTGTHIRGATVPSPTIEITAADIRAQGFSDLGEAIRALPQNFRGGENPGVVRVSQSQGAPVNGNQAGGSALNLRGLGPGASLTLLNGRRMSYGGDNQAVDITPIPVAAVQRVDIVTDGASAIYGSDAVGGVGNVVLRRDFDGVAIDTEHGTATRGGLTSHNYGLTAGKVWSSGNVLFTYSDNSRDAVYASDRSYTDYLNDPYTIFPKIDEEAGLLSFNQAFGSSVDFSVDALSSKRRQFLASGYGDVYTAYRPRTRNDLISPEVVFWLPNDWRLSLNGSWGKNTNTQDLADTNVGDGATEPFSKYALKNKISTYQLDAEGPLFDLSGGEARLAAGLGHRENEFRYQHHMFENTWGGKNRSDFAYLELDLPFVSSASGVAGVDRFSVSLSARAEDYSSFGSVTTPKVGVIYGPNPDFTVRGTWGKSFKAPTLGDRFSGQYGWIGWAVDDGYQGDADFDGVDLYVTGGNPDLGPEKARQWTTSLSWHPQAFPGLQIDLSGFDIDYKDRIVEPIPNSVFALSNPAYGSFVILDPSADEYHAIADNLLEIDNWLDIEYSPDSLYAIILDHMVNAQRQRIRGLDLTGSQRIDVGLGTLTLSGNFSFLKSTQVTVPGEPSEDLSGTIYNPAKKNFRAGAVWSFNGFSMAGYFNHTGRVVDNYWDEAASAKLPSINTVDLTFRYDSSASGPWADTSVALAVRNALDRKPPLFEAPSEYVLPYDATNASPIGRYISLALAKKW